MNSILHHNGECILWTGGVHTQDLAPICYRVPRNECIAGHRTQTADCVALMLHPASMHNKVCISANHLDFEGNSSNTMRTTCLSTNSAHYDMKWWNSTDCRVNIYEWDLIATFYIIYFSAINSICMYYCLYSRFWQSLSGCRGGGGNSMNTNDMLFVGFSVTVSFRPSLDIQCDGVLCFGFLSFCFSIVLLYTAMSVGGFELQDPQVDPSCNRCIYSSACWGLPFLIWMYFSCSRVLFVSSVTSDLCWR